jgi:hypothetical protein
LGRHLATGTNRCHGGGRCVGRGWGRAVIVIVVVIVVVVFIQ